MKTNNLLFLLLLFALSNILAQQYPQVTIRDIQFVEADSLMFYGDLGTEPFGSYEGDTVRVSGVVMNQVHYGTNPDSAEYLHSGAPAFFMQDPDEAAWGGIIVRDPDAHSDFAVLDTGFVVNITGVILSYFTTTQINVIDFSASDVTGIQLRPKAAKITLDSLQGENQAPNWFGEKWESVYVEIENLTVVNNQALGNNSFLVADNQNRQMVIYTTGDYFRNRFQVPVVGTFLKNVRGMIADRNDATGRFILNPLYPDDIQLGDILPPIVSGVERNSATVGFGQAVSITATLDDSDGEVVAGKVFYSLNDAPSQSVALNRLAPTDIWTADIPGQNDSSLVSYFIMAEDNDGIRSYFPADTVNGRFFYFVLNRDLQIRDLQYSPFGNGFSAYNNYEVTVSGVVTADTSDVEGDGSNISPQVYIQDGSGPWTGVQIFGTEAESLSKGDLVTVTGIVNESFGVTRIGDLNNGASVTLLSSGNDLPAPFEISTADISNSTSGTLPAESFEGVLVSYKNVTVADENADGNAGPDEGTGGNRNFGEMLVSDQSVTLTRVEMQDGTHDYHNYWDFLLEDTPLRVKVNDTFDEIIGIMFYSFSNYKLVPRNNEDFVGWSGAPPVSVENDLGVYEYSLRQNYPNPFNPSTSIKYSLRDDGFVKIKVFNVLGEEVFTLIDEFKKAGVHSANFDAGLLASGIYLYQINVNDFRSVKKMMLVK